MGAVVARNGEVVAAAHNTRETEKNALHHAELLAIDAACKKLGGWRLWECELFVTLEPCPMCAEGHHQQPRPAGGIRRGRHQGGLLRQCDRPVRNALQPPSGGGEAVCVQRRHRRCCRRFSKTCGHGLRPSRSGNRLYDRGMEYEETVKSGSCVKKAGGFHFLFSANCAILFNGVLSKPILCSCLSRRAPDFDRKEMDAERTAMGRRDISCTAYLCSAEITTGGPYSCTKMNLN